MILFHYTILKQRTTIFIAFYGLECRRSACEVIMGLVGGEAFSLISDDRIFIQYSSISPTGLLALQLHRFTESVRDGKRSCQRAGRCQRRPPRLEDPAYRCRTRAFVQRRAGRSVRGTRGERLSLLACACMYTKYVPRSRTDVNTPVSANPSRCGISVHQRTL